MNDPPPEEKKENRGQIGGDDTGKTFVKRQWDNNLDFLVSCLSMSVGLGNFWRFPYICYKNGGGAFIIPYAIILILVGRPLYYLDLAMGQFSSRGSIHMYGSLAPAWLGIGITQCICCFCVISYYSYILAVGFFYFLQSFTEELPWDTCLPKWGNHCSSGWGKSPYRDNLSVSSAELYLTKYVLKSWDITDNGVGPADWRLIICCFITFCMVFLNCMVGIKSTAKASYFLALFPIVVMAVLLVRAGTLPGASTGIMYLLTPNWKKLLDGEVWMAAATQIYFSLGIGFNIIANYASYNNIHQKINRCALIMALADTFCSLLASLTIFSSLGSLAYRINLPVDKVLRGAGMTLVFVSYADAIAKFGTAPYIFAIVFFVMFVALGLGSLVSFAQVIISNMLEIWPYKMKEWHAAVIVCTIGFFSSIIYTTRIFAVIFFAMFYFLGLGSLVSLSHVLTANLMELWPHKVKEWHSSLIVCFFGFFTSIIYTTRGGSSTILDMVDCYGTVYVLSLVAFFQAIAICHTHGLMNWCWNLEFMTKTNTSFYWRWTWAIICPVAMAIIYIHSLIGSQQALPKLYRMIGLCLLILTTCPIAITIIIAVVKRRKLGCTGAFRKAFSSENWKPFTEANQIEFQAFYDAKLADYKMADATPFRKFLYALVHKQ